MAIRTTLQRLGERLDEELDAVLCGIPRPDNRPADSKLRRLSERLNDELDAVLCEIPRPVKRG